MQVYKDNDGNRRTPADVGATYISDDRAAELGWAKVSADYEREATKDEMKRAELAEALGDYNSALAVAKERILTAQIDSANKDKRVAVAVTLATDAKTAYTAARNAIIAKYADA